MENALVILDDREQISDLLKEAAAYATGADTELVLYSPLSREEHGEALETLDQIGDIENKDYREEDALGLARTSANDLATEALREFDIEWSVVPDVTDEVEPDRIIEVAEKNDCDHVYALGQRRSPTGKAVFGDTTQRLILNFPGFVTVMMT